MSTRLLLGDGWLAAEIAAIEVLLDRTEKIAGRVELDRLLDCMRRKGCAPMWRSRFYSLASAIDPSAS